MLKKGYKMDYEMLVKQIKELPTQYVALVQELVDALGSSQNVQGRQHLDWLKETWDVKDTTPITREELHER